MNIVAATRSGSLRILKCGVCSKSMSELSDCYLFGYALPLAEGEVCRVTWKAWRSGGALGLKWELRRILPDLGFEYTSAGTKVCKQWARLSPVWKGLAESLGMSEVESLLGAASTSKHAQSASSVTPDGETASQSAEANFWVSSVMLLLVLLHFAERGHKQVTKSKAGCCLQMLLAFASGVELEAMSDVEGLVRAQCYTSIDESGNCCHVASALSAGVEMAGECEGHKRAYLTLVHLFRLRDSCPSCKGHLAALLGLVGASIDGRAGTWRNGLVQLPELMGPSGVKRRRVDPHVRASILATAQKDERKRAWIASDESTRLVSAEHVFAGAQYIASAFDGGRIGKPQKDCLIHWILEPCGEVAYCLPPQVVICQNIRCSMIAFLVPTLHHIPCTIFWMRAQCRGLLLDLALAGSLSLCLDTSRSVTNNCQ
eukprot:4400454-Amphidinium_carterae.1